MRRRLASFAFGSALAFAGAMHPGAAAAKSPECFDLAVVATLESTDWRSLQSDDPSLIIMDADFHWKFRIERRLAGAEARSVIEVVNVQHTSFNPEIRHYLLFLHRLQRSRYHLVDMDFQVVRDVYGHLVIPVAQPFTPDDLESAWYIPANYRELLRPAHYRAEDAWWLQLPADVTAYAGPPPQPADFPWGKFSDGYIKATLALPVADLLKAAVVRRCPAK